MLDNDISIKYSHSANIGLAVIVIRKANLGGLDFCSSVQTHSDTCLNYFHYIIKNFYRAIKFIHWNRIFNGPTCDSKDISHTPFENISPIWTVFFLEKETADILLFYRTNAFPLTLHFQLNIIHNFISFLGNMHWINRTKFFRLRLKDFKLDLAFNTVTPKDWYFVLIFSSALLCFQTLMLVTTPHVSC